MAKNFFNWMDHFGYTANMHAETLPGRKTHPVEAVCTSEYCSATGYGRVKKSANKTDVFCPDCGFALYWRKKHSK